MPRKIIDKPYNAGTMSSSAFFGFIRSGLRQKSRWWKPLQAAKVKARRAYKGTNKRQKWEYKCAVCNKYFKDTFVIVDHIIPVGALSSFEDLVPFVKKLFVEENGFQILCKPCHQIKTNTERKQGKYKHL